MTSLYCRPSTDTGSFRLYVRLSDKVKCLHIIYYYIILYDLPRYHVNYNHKNVLTIHENLYISFMIIFGEPQHSELKKEKEIYTRQILIWHRYNLVAPKNLDFWFSKVSKTKIFGIKKSKWMKNMHVSVKKSSNIIQLRIKNG